MCRATTEDRSVAAKDRNVTVAREKLGDAAAAIELYETIFLERALDNDKEDGPARDLLVKIKK